MLKDYNWQFSLFGNKGIVNKYIIHLIETRLNAAVFHGCAVRRPSDGQVVVGLGGSGSGKSVFIMNALSMGWELVATEHVIISDSLRICKGNVYDNVSPLSKESYEKLLKKAVIYEKKQLVEPVGRKILVGLQEYAMTSDSFLADEEKLDIILLDFYGKGNVIQEINDEDFFLRILQISSSEKLVFPAIAGKDMPECTLCGNPVQRMKVIDRIINGAAGRIILGGGHEGFRAYLKYGNNSSG